MFAVESEYGFVACAISVMAIDDNGCHVKNVVQHINEDYKNVLNDSNCEEQKKWNSK